MTESPMAPPNPPASIQLIIGDSGSLFSGDGVDAVVGSGGGGWCCGWEISWDGIESPVMFIMGVVEDMMGTGLMK